MKRYKKNISLFRERSKSWPVFISDAVIIENNLIKPILSCNKEECFCISLRDLEY